MPSVETYIQNQDSPQKEIVLQLRTIILQAAPNVKEELKNGVPWYGKFYIAAFKDHVNLGFSVQGLKPEETAQFDGKGKFMRHLKFRSPIDIDTHALSKMIKLIAEKSGCDDC